MRSEILLIIIGMGAVTYLPRWLPLAFLSRRPLPAWLVDWLPAVIAARRRRLLRLLSLAAAPCQPGSSTGWISSLRQS